MVPREAAGSRTWETALEQLAAGYRRALGVSRRNPKPGPLRRAA
jgi:hypothetical protein